MQEGTIMDGLLQQGVLGALILGAYGLTWLLERQQRRDMKDTKALALAAKEHTEKHERECAERNEKLAHSLGSLDHTLATFQQSMETIHGRISKRDERLETLTLSINQLNTTVSVLMDREGRT